MKEAQAKKFEHQSVKVILYSADELGQTLFNKLRKQGISLETSQHTIREYGDEWYLWGVGKDGTFLAFGRPYKSTKKDKNGKSLATSWTPNIEVIKELQLIN